MRTLVMLWLLVSTPLYAAEAALFADLLAEAGLVFTPPADFQPVTVQENPLLPYEHALRHQQAALEIRYAVRPLARIEIDYQDPHSAAPEPNHMFPLLFQSLTNQLAAGNRAPSNEYPSGQARERFNADWAAAAVFDVQAAFAQNYRQGLLVALHKNRQADVYVVFLFNEYAAVKDLINETLGALRFG